MSTLPMKRFGASTFASFGVAALALVGCSKDEARTADEPGLAITVLPLQLQGIQEVVYKITVKNAQNETVWVQDDLASTQYGDGKGGLAYVGSCDASDGANPHRVELVIKSVTETGGQAASFQNPAPEGKPLWQPATCVENRDVPVVFNVTVMREANQGFFDVAVNFSDIFCSAKFDCADANGDPLTLLHNAVGDRARTLVMGFACTSGAPAQAGGTNTTWLHLTDVRVECLDENVPPNVTVYPIDPSRGEGNIGEVNPIFYQVGAYRDQEDLQPYDKCFWNMAFGINEGIAAIERCTLRVQGTASDESWIRPANDPDGSSGWSPKGSVYPYIDWKIPLTNDQGQVICDQHPLNAGDEVTTQYTDFAGAKFTHEWQCGGDTITTEKVSCSATVTGVGDASASFIQTPDGISVAFGAEPPSAPYLLPAEYGEVSDCCFNPCCTSETPPPTVP